MVKHLFMSYMVLLQELSSISKIVYVALWMCNVKCIIVFGPSVVLSFIITARNTMTYCLLQFRGLREPRVSYTLIKQDAPHHKTNSNAFEENTDGNVHSD